MQELEFSVGPDEEFKLETADSTEYAEKFLEERQKKDLSNDLTIVLFDYESNFFKNSKAEFPERFKYQLAKNLSELNKALSSEKPQLIVFHYDANSKVVNHLCAQIKKKFPNCKTLIMAKSISPQKALVHAKTPSGADGYYQLPLDSIKIESEFLKIIQTDKIAG